MQEGDIAACPKHFIGSESETKRRHLNLKEDWDGRTMREIYLSAFQTLLRESEPLAIMTAYNKLDGTFCSECSIIRNLLREEWGYEGLVMSDWFGTRSGIPALKAGLDLEMPGPSAFRGERIVEAIESGCIDEEMIKKCAGRVLSLILKKYRIYSREEKNVVNEDVSALSRRIATEVMVLLKNERNILPLNAGNSPEIAVFGPFAVKPPISGGGSGCAPPQHHTSPLDCLRTFISMVEYSEGYRTHTSLPHIPLEQIHASKGQPGIDIDYFIHSSPEPVLHETIPSARTAMLGFIKPPLTQETSSHFTISTTITPLTTGKHQIGTQATSAFTFSINGVQVLCDAMKPAPSVEDFLFVPQALERCTSIHMTAGQTYTISASIQHYTTPTSHTPGEPDEHAATLTYLESYSDSSLLSRATDLAKSTDISLIFCGRDKTMESEGFHLTTLSLPPAQET